MASEIAELGVKSIAIGVDASSKEGLRKAEEKICAQIGPATILINAPGINSSTPFLEITEEEWHKILDVN